MQQVLVKSNGIFIKNSEEISKLISGCNIYILTQLISNIGQEKMDITIKIPHVGDICSKAYIPESVIQVYNSNISNRIFTM